MASDASHMLEAALEQMDDIIAGKTFIYNGLYDLGSPVSVGPLPVLQLAEELRLALELQARDEDRNSLRSQLPCTTAQTLMEWLEKGPVRHLKCSSNNETYQERLARLEVDKESLVLQVSVLTDQVEAQGEKIRDLESSLEEHNHKLISTEEMLQQELLSRTSLETQKLELMDEVSYLKLKLVGMEEEHNHIDEQQKHHKAEALLQELRLLKSKVEELEGEKSQYERKLKATKTEIAKLQQLLATKDAEIECLQNQLLSRGTVNNDITERDQELQRLKTGMETLIAANSQKVSKHLCALRLLTGLKSAGSSMRVVTGRGVCLWTKHQLYYVSEGSTHRGTQSSNRYNPENNKYQTLPGKFSRPEQNGVRLQQSSPLQLSPDESEDSEFNLSKQFSHSTHNDSTLSDLSPMSSGVESGQQSPVSPEHKKNQKGIRKLWGKIRRTQSGSLPADSSDSDFKRGGFRATAGPRLTCLGAGASARDTNAPFSKWSCDQVCAWMEEFGLCQYVNMARQWVTSGQTLLSASSQDFEKELGIKNPLHRKKLQLALRSFSTKITEKSSELDHIWVTRWLDDIGLPQYKDQFSEGRVDGRMLQYLTVNDLLFLKVSSQLHHLSIKCAIHVLHVNKFNSNCLKRRPGDENKTSPSEVVQWSNHRVMEWLRSVDLAEYAPNLRGSGVHGGLIILEPRFNSDTLAMLLNIPPQKTLLRRHLATNFNTLMGSQAQQEKQEYLESSGCTPLTTTAKVRPRKIGFSSFGHRKKRSDDSTDYICPLDASQAQALLNGASRPYSGFRGLSPIFDRDPERRVQVGALQI
uniref:Liprin-beta-2-like n=1 Tax=Sinocyclocheilus anshuiensis TaxID=1608454 RepID=A0A671M468_9TELE